MEVRALVEARTSAVLQFLPFLRESVTGVVALDDSDMKVVAGMERKMDERFQAASPRDDDEKDGSPPTSVTASGRFSLALATARCGKRLGGDTN